MAHVYKNFFDIIRENRHDKSEWSQLCGGKWSGGMCDTPNLLS